MSLDLSIGEVESLVFKACRGAGMAWGIAEDAGRIAGFLARQNVDGLSALASLLTQNDGKRFDDIAPMTSGDILRARGGTLCPVATGCLLSDLTGDLQTDYQFELENVSYPILLAGFLGAIAERNGRTFEATGKDLAFHCSPTGLYAIEEINALPEVANIAVKSVKPVNCLPNETAIRAICSQAAFDTLSAFAHRTYVPATEASRMSGAGAGVNDND